MSRVSERVVLGMDPHKRSATIEVMAADEVVWGPTRHATNRRRTGGIFGRSS